MSADRDPVIPNFGKGSSCVTGDHAFCWDWVRDHWGDTLQPALVQHIELTAIAVGIGFALAFPLALVAHRYRRLEQPIGVLSALLYTIPSLALFQILVPFTGLTWTTVEIALVSYTLVILFPNIVAGSAQRAGRGPRGGARDGAHAAAGPDARRAAARGAGDRRRACASRSSRPSRSRRSPRSCCRTASATRSSSRSKEPTPFKTEIYSAGALAVALALVCDGLLVGAAADARPVGAEGCRVITRRHREPAHVRRRRALHRRQPRASSRRRRSSSSSFPVLRS